jgi:hypothetical protein
MRFGSVLFGSILLISSLASAQNSSTFPVKYTSTSTGTNSITTQESSALYYLTLWNAKIQNQYPYGTWDYNSLPDPIINIFHQGELIYTLSKQNNILMPQWNKVVGVFSHQDLERGPLEVYIYDQDLLSKQLIEIIVIPSPRAEFFGKIIGLKGDFVHLYVQWQPTIQNTESRMIDLTDETVSYHRFPEWIHHKSSKIDIDTALTKDQSTKVIINSQSSDRITSKKHDDHHELSLHLDSKKKRIQVRLDTEKKQRQSKQLFKKYLKAYFDGDQIYAHHMLLELSVRFPHTPHGRKARRILLLASH